MERRTQCYHHYLTTNLLIYVIFSYFYTRSLYMTYKSKPYTVQNYNLHILYSNYITSLYGHLQRVGVRRDTSPHIEFCEIMF